jgi:hypothetical protein
MIEYDRVAPRTEGMMATLKTMRTKRMVKGRQVVVETYDIRLSRDGIDAKIASELRIRKFTGFRSRAKAVAAVAAINERGPDARRKAQSGVRRGWGGRT